jgi:hypothetical protein
MQALFDYSGGRTGLPRVAPPRLPLSTILLALVLGAAWPQGASAADNPLKVSLSAGTAYDDDVTISQLDSSTGQSDGVADVNLTTNYDLIKDKSKSLSVGYTFDQNVHFNFHQYDIGSQGISTVAGYTIDKINFGMVYDFNYITLGGNNFMKMNFLNPSVMISLSKNIYVRSHLIYIDESFFHLSDHNAKHFQPGAQAFYFFNKSKSYLIFSGTYVKENTSGPQFTYHGFTAGVSGNFLINLPKSSFHIKLLYEYTYKNYNNIDPSIGANRFDRQSEYAINFIYPLSKKLDLTISGHRFVRSSNFAPANIDQNVIATSLSYMF